MAEIKSGYSMYDFNASLVKNYPPLKWAGLNKAKFIINDFHNNHKNRHHIALCHNLRYSTVENVSKAMHLLRLYGRNTTKFINDDSQIKK